MKKIISVLLIITVLFSAISLSAYAIQPGDGTFGNATNEFDISQFTDSELDLSKLDFEEVLQMPAEEFSLLVRDFERVYDPFGTYDAEADFEAITQDTASPQWSSGHISLDGEWNKTGSHEILTRQACQILGNGKGFFTDNNFQNLSIMLAICIGSLKPDDDEIGIFPFAGHFYDPNTKKNYAGETDNTALTNATNHYDLAIQMAKNNDMPGAYEQIGRCLHYIQDVCEPHHSANITGLDLVHTEFERYAHENIEIYLSGYTSISNADYLKGGLYPVSTHVHNAALDANKCVEYVDSILEKNNFETYAKNCIRNAAKYSTMVLYKFGTNSAVPFILN